MELHALELRRQKAAAPQPVVQRLIPAGSAQRNQHDERRQILVLATQSISQPRTQTRTPGKLKAWADKVGWDKLANTRGPTWRRIPEDRRANLTEAKMISLLEANSSAIRRPIVESGITLLVGFDEKEFTARL